MTENRNFNRALAASGKSMYALARLCGVPYTTINEIHRGKNDINQCAAGTVQRIAAGLGVSSEEILNEIRYLDGVRGKYRGIDFVWSTGACSQITFTYEGEDVTISAGKQYNIASRIEYYNIVAGWMIKEYTKRQQWKREVLGRIGRTNTDE